MSDVAVRIPAPLRPFTADAAEVVLAAGTAATVADALDALITRHPKLRLHLFHEDGRLRPFVNLYVNEQDVRALDGTATRLEAGDALTIVPSIAGGEAPLTGLSRAEIERYARHLVMPEVGPAGQRKLKAARVLIVG
ncbi:MAG: ubiquitin-like small modifier protein 1, partial [Longimicrobiales bacterium]